MSDFEQRDGAPSDADHDVPSIHEEDTSEFEGVPPEFIRPGTVRAASQHTPTPENTPDTHEQATVPITTDSLDRDAESIPPEAAHDAHDPKKTLPGSGGFDPNPDFMPPTAPHEAPRPPAPTQQNDPGYTVPHIVPFEHTLVHVPGEEGRQRPPEAQPGRRASTQEAKAAQFQQSYRPAQPPPQYTAPNAGQGYAGYPPPAPPTYSQPYTQANPNVQPGYGPPGSIPQPGSIPPPPAGNPVAGGIPRSAPRARRILGCTPGCVAIFAGIMVSFCGGLTLILILLSATLGSRLEQQLTAQVSQVEDYNNFESTFFYDRNGELLYEAFTEGRRTNVRFEDFPQTLIDATIAIEDDSFFDNPGFEVEATLRAFLQYVGLGEGSSGGSTITQQLVRNVLFDIEYRSERSVQRKVEEILLAYLLTQRMSKEDVLAMYLNEIYYGNLAYGAAAAARVFFDKDVRDLTLAEAALLAGLPQAPATYDPFSPDPEIQADIDVRWRTVLDRMVTEGFITDAERNTALREGYSVNPPDAPLNAPHFTVYARAELEQRLIDLGFSADDAARGGLRVYTTLDLRVQRLAEQAAQNQVSGLAGYNVTNGAVVVTQPVTGQIFAMVGSVDYNNEAIDGRVNVTTSLRQPGSTMKPLTYAAALERGMTLGDIIWDTETVIADYEPVNYDGNWHGPVRFRSALANSYNIPAVQTLRTIGVDALLEISSRFGIESLGQDASLYGLSLTLGGGEVTLLELTRAYSVFANNGVYVPTTAILCIVDNDGTIRYQYENGCITGQPTPQTVNVNGFGTTVIDPRVAYMITDILSDNAARTPAMGGNSPLNTGGLYSAVKTGTTDDFRDNWTVGYNRNLAVGVWVGNSSGAPMSAGTSGLTGAAPIWNAVITGVYNAGLIDEFTVEGGRLPDRLDAPSGLSYRSLCAIPALRDPAPDCAQSIQELFLDTPAGVPDGQGGLQYPSAPQTQPEQPPQTGVWLREVEPDIYRVVVHPLPPNLGIQLTIPGQSVQPPSPIYCQVPMEAIPSDPAAREQLFIAPPPDPADAARAEQWARANGYAFLPTIACTIDLINATGGTNVITAFITEPSAGQSVFAGMPILGTASFSPQQAQYYKLELYGGQFGENWVTMGTTHNNAVVNGVLETMPGLQPGNYILQLVVVGNDGNYVQPPYQVPFNVP
ncbi:MAG: transglycosylase domain-containing protein [bacterium]|nr:transglycosylase domain-containing protein [bacterium]